MVEFISEATEQAESEDPPPEEEVSKQESLEELVEAEAEELPSPESGQEYVSESSEPEYTQANDFAIDLRDSKNSLKPLVYMENGMPVVVDIFELYGKNQPEDDKSFLKKSL